MTHIEKIRKAQRVSEGKCSVYETIYDYDELKGYWVRRMDDLGYPLRVEPKRDRIVMNKRAFDEALKEATVEAIEMSQREMYAFIRNQVYDEIKNETEYLLNSISYTPGKGFKAAQNYKGNDLMKLATFLGKTLANNIIYVFNDIIRGGRKSNRKKRK